MLQIILVDIRRILASKLTWVAVGLALAIVASQVVRMSAQEGVWVGLQDEGLRLEWGAFLGSGAQEMLSTGRDILLREAGARVIGTAYLSTLSYLALAVSAVFGGFFVRDRVSGYNAVRRARGISARQLQIANALTISVVSLILGVLGVAWVFLVSALVATGELNPVAAGQVIFVRTAFLRGLAAYSAWQYAALVAGIYAVVFTFLGLLGQRVSAAFQDYLVAALAPVGLLAVLGPVASRPGWWLLSPLRYDSLGFTDMLITMPSDLAQYVGTYLAAAVALFVLGLVLPLFGSGRR